MGWGRGAPTAHTGLTPDIYPAKADTAQGLNSQPVHMVMDMDTHGGREAQDGSRSKYKGSHKT